MLIPDHQLWNKQPCSLPNHYGFITPNTYTQINFYGEWFIGLACSVICTNKVQLFTVNPKKQNILQFVSDTPYLTFEGHWVYLISDEMCSRPLRRVLCSLQMHCFIDSDPFSKPMSFTRRTVINLVFPSTSQVPAVVSFWILSSSVMPFLVFVHWNVHTVSQREMCHSLPGVQLPAHLKDAQGIGSLFGLQHQTGWRALGDSCHRCHA